MCAYLAEYGLSSVSNVFFSICDEKNVGVFVQVMMEERDIVAILPKEVQHPVEMTQH